MPTLARDLILDKHLPGHDLTVLRLRVVAADEEIALLREGGGDGRFRRSEPAARGKREGGCQQQHSG